MGWYAVCSVWRKKIANSSALKNQKDLLTTTWCYTPLTGLPSDDIVNYRRIISEIVNVIADSALHVGEFSRGDLCKRCSLSIPNEKSHQVVRYEDRGSHQYDTRWPNSWRSAHVLQLNDACAGIPSCTHEKFRNILLVCLWKCCYSCGTRSLLVICRSSHLYYC